MAIWGGRGGGGGLGVVRQLVFCWLFGLEQVHLGAHFRAMNLARFGMVGGVLLVVNPLCSDGMYQPPINYVGERLSKPTGSVSDMLANHTVVIATQWHIEVFILSALCLG